MFAILDTINTLPEGWVVVRHESGGNVYLHKQSRVCTWSKPYTVSSSKTIKVVCNEWLYCYVYYRSIRYHLVVYLV